METKKKFGFIVHCRNLRELRLVAARYRLSPFSLLPAQMLKSHLLKKGYVNDIFTFRNVVSDRQIVCQGKAFCLLMTPEQMLENQNLTTELVKQGCRMAADWGAEMVGLGAICAVVGARGVEAAESCSAAVTTGNSLTAYAAFVQFEKIMARLGEDPARHKIVMVGFPGSITLVLTKMLYEKGLSLVLVSRRKTAFLKKFLDGIDGGEGRIEITQDMGEALKQGRIVFSATSSGDIINQNDLLPGSVVFDIAQPKDVVFQQVPRQDVLIVDAGLISLPRATTDQYRYSGWQANDIPSCLGETITLTLEQRWENYSLGRELVIEKIRQIGGLSEKHGFVFDKFRTFTRPITDVHFEIAGKALRSAA